MKIEVRGLAGLERALKEELPKSTARGVLTRTGRKALQPIADRMAELAPYDPEDRDEDGQHLNETMRVQPAKAKLARALGVPRQSGVVLLAGPAPKGRRMRLVAQNLEYGTGERFHRSGKGTGALPAQPYARPAADSLDESAVETVKQELAKEIEKAKARIARKAARSAAGGG